MHSLRLQNECRKLRRKGWSLNDIMRLKKLPKTTIYYWIRDIKLSPVAQKILWDNYIGKIIEENKKKKNFGFKRREIKNKPRYWSKDLITIVSHFFFDGQIRKSGCIYSNRSEAQINRLKKLMRQKFNLVPITLIKLDGVIRISYHYMDLGDYMTGIYINPDRKNSRWKKKIEKRKILEKAIDSYYA